MPHGTEYMKVVFQKYLSEADILILLFNLIQEYFDVIFTQPSVARNFSHSRLELEEVEEGVGDTQDVKNFTFEK